MSAIRHFLQRRLEAGEWVIGQVRVRPGISLCHVEEAHASERQVFSRPEDARELAKYDDAGAYRPLKTAPNLRRGWELRLHSAEELQRALDIFYPAAIGTWLAWEKRELAAVPLRDTLNRQTGMYRVTQLIRDDQAEALIAKVCGEGCLRRRLWRIANPNPSPELGGAELPVLCVEACNLLVAGCRPLAKENLPKPV